MNMITKFKIFENNELAKFWVVNNDEHFLVSLYKIGMSFGLINTFKFLNKRKDKYYFIGTYENKWYWTKYNYTVDSNEFVRKGYYFQYFVEVDNDDIKKYNYDYDIYLLKKDVDIKKYNL